ncbi:hypothetical protein AJ80_08043 [Polytolypa hystricis UAMH7299]|uniref:Uncharacterized protein n=1 Tax=Polytolypa hystricis (strain UAMH7299) TaxID=1447883 RepID=A0A2B7XF26_POLH7|nr:hypothetical protein AJ80_08043 [Polytolypa hystricis UAMH7299]
MFPCVNESRGCRGRVNSKGTKCEACVASGLRRSRFSSVLRDTPNYRSSWDIEMARELKSQDKL